MSTSGPGVDTHEMVLIHRVIRREFGQLPDCSAPRPMTVRDRRSSARTPGRCCTSCTRTTPARTSCCSPAARANPLDPELMDRMDAQHAQVNDAVAAVGGAAAWTASADPPRPADGGHHRRRDAGPDRSPGRGGAETAPDRLGHVIAGGRPSLLRGDLSPPTLRGSAISGKMRIPGNSRILVCLAGWLISAVYLDLPSGIRDAGNGGFPVRWEARVTAARRRQEAPVPCSEPGCSTLVLWAERAGRRRARGPAGGGLRFAFYGRVSTEDWQDPESSRVRQREQAGALVRGHGIIAAEFFDIGQSRSVAWGRRPKAAALVAALADPERDWGRGRGRGVRAGVLRRPVRADGTAVRALRRPALAARGRRPGRLRLRA